MSESLGFDGALVELAEQSQRLRTVCVAVQARRTLREISKERALFDDELDLLSSVDTIMSTELVQLTPKEREIATRINEWLMERALARCALQQLIRAYY